MPLFIEELTKTVLNRLQDNEQSRRAPPMWALSADLVPTSLYSSLMARLDRLSVGKEIAQIGAVVGREFSFDMVQALSALPTRQVENALAELAQAGIIVAHGKPPFATYTFRHALVHDAAYASLLRDRRRAIHMRLAEEMEKDAAGAATEPQLIAWHYAEAGAPASAIEHYRKAAEHATGRFAVAERVRTGDPQALLMIRRAESQANLLLGRFEPAREAMQHVVDMYDLERDGPHAGMSIRDSKVSISTLLGMCLTILGYADSGRDELDGRAARRDVEPSHQPQSRTAARLR